MRRPTVASTLDAIRRAGNRQRETRAAFWARHRKEPFHLPVRMLDDGWPYIAYTAPRSLRWPLNSARYIQVRIVWPVVVFLSRLLPLGRWTQGCLVASWTFWACVAYLGAAFTAGIALIFLWLPLTIVTFACRVVASWCGWTPPGGLTTADLQLLNSASTTQRPPWETGDTWDWNHANDPQLRLQWEQTQAMHRANDLQVQAIALQSQPMTYDTAPDPDRRLDLRMPAIVTGIVALLMIFGAWQIGHGDNPVPPSPDPAAAAAAQP